MKKIHKRALGFLSLSLVAVVTIFAAFLPDFDAGAVSSVTDTIQVRVVNDKPEVDPEVNPEIITPTYDEDDSDSTTIASIIADSSLSNTIVVDGKQKIGFSYSSVGEVKITIYYTDKYGVTHESVYETFNANYEPGEYRKVIDFSADGYGYGDYVIKIVGIGADGVPDDAIVAFSYYPVDAKVVKSNTTGVTKLNVRYDKDYVARLKINIYDKNGNLIIPPSPIYESDLDGSGKLSMELLLSEYGLTDGKYRLEFIAYDKYGLVLYKPISLWMEYSTINVPNTNKTTNWLLDYDCLIIGLIMFLALGILFLLIVSRKKKEEK